MRDLIRRHFGRERFLYVYHIDQSDGGDRVLDIASDGDVQFDEEFYKHLQRTHGAALREKLFFFIDNRNVIGKDIPFQLDYQRRYGQPLFRRSVVLAHDVDDFSKIWQAMGRSRTMNETRFTIYKSQIGAEAETEAPLDIKRHPLTRQLYVRNCDQKMAGNLSSIYQTLVSLYNLAQDRFYYPSEIANVFIDKMEMTIVAKVRRHELALARSILEGDPVAATILTHILGDKFRRAASPAIASAQLAPPLVRAVLGHVVQQKFEQRVEADAPLHYELLRFLCGEQEGGTMEISYTKQQQKQKQTQSNKNQDQDTMEAWDRRHQLTWSDQTDNYFEYTLRPGGDLGKAALHAPFAVPIVKLAYVADGRRRHINVYPTLQFLYSHHVYPEYVTREVKELLESLQDPADFCRRFLEGANAVAERDAEAEQGAAAGGAADLGLQVLVKTLALAGRGRVGSAPSSTTTRCG